MSLGTTLINLLTASVSLALEVMKKRPDFEQKKILELSELRDAYVFERNKRRDDPTRDDDLVLNLREQLLRDVETVAKVLDGEK